MAKRKTIEAAAGEAATNPDSATQTPVNFELPFVTAASISPAKTEPEPAPETDAGAAPTADETAVAAVGLEQPTKTETPKRPLFALRPRQKRHVLLAASVAIAAAFGAIVGAAATGGFSRPVAIDVAGEESRATQQSVARLAKEVTSLKASLETASKSASSQFARISERLNREGADVTGSIAPPQSVPPASQASAPLQPPRPSILADWTIRETRDGYVYVQGHHGDVYQVVPGAPLPGLGPVEKIKRQDGRWLVVTPKGIIVSMRDRRYFEQF
jgi:hypothetical protein